MTTVAQTITDAMVDAGLLLEGAAPSTAQYTKYIRRLNDLIHLQQTKGLKLWLERDVSVTLVASTSSYIITSGDLKAMRVKQAYFLDADDNKRPVDVISRDEYTRLSNNATTGPVVSIFPEKLVTSLKAWVWQIPDATAALGTLHLITQVQVTSYTASTDDLTISFPQEWAIYLRWGLADEICTGQPQSIMDRCAKKAAQFLDALEDWDVEDASTRFEPSVNSQSPSRFA